MLKWQREGKKRAVQMPVGGGRHGRERERECERQRQRDVKID